MKAKQYLRLKSLHAIGEPRISSPYTSSSIAYQALIAAAIFSCTYFKPPPTFLSYHATSKSEWQEIPALKSQFTLLLEWFPQFYVLWEMFILVTEYLPRRSLSSSLPTTAAFSWVKKKRKRNKINMFWNYSFIGDKRCYTRAIASFEVLDHSQSFKYKQYKNLLCSPFLIPL